MTVEQHAKRALRSIQIYDEVMPAAANPNARQLLLDAEDHLGAILGLSCTGVKEPGGYDHSAGTCPVHEWVRPQDHRLAERYVAGARPS